MTFVLREYQDECVTTILNKFMEMNSQIVQLPTGAGKTVILWNVLKSLNQKALIVAPTRELTEQLEETGQSIVGEENVYLKKKSYWPKDRKYLVMTGQASTFAMKNGELFKFNPKVLVIDEAHRARSKNIEALINEFKDRGALVLGLTATPGS